VLYQHISIVRISLDKTPDTTLSSEATYVRSFTSQSVIDREIEALLAKVAALRTRRNELASISRLPLEALTLILVSCLPALEDYRVLPPYVSVKGFPFMRVCRYWRHIALSCPLLWCTIPCKVLPITREFLAKSKNAPLSIAAFSGPVAAMTEALGQLYRARELHLEASADVINKNTKNLSQPAPLLVSCSITGRGMSFSNIRLPHRFLGLQAPNLRRLQLSGIAFDWEIVTNPQIVGRLSYFELGEINADGRPSLPQMIAALRAMPSLNKLVLSAESLPIPFASRSSQLSISVALEQLTQLKLQGCMQNVSALLEVIKTPPTTALDFEVTDSSASGDFTALKGVLGSRFTNGVDGPSIRRLSYTVYSKKTEIAAYSCPQIPGVRECVLHLAISQPFYDVLSIHSAVSQKDVKIIELSAERSSEEHIRRILVGCDAASELHLTGQFTCITTLPLLLPRRYSPNDGNDICPALLPHLHTLRLSGANFSLHNPTHTLLCDILAQRARLPCVPLSVNIINCRNVNEEVIRALRTIAGEREIAWDEYVAMDRM
jgi:hypothetical protein